MKKYLIRTYYDVIEEEDNLARARQKAIAHSARHRTRVMVSDKMHHNVFVAENGKKALGMN